MCSMRLIQKYITLCFLLSGIYVSTPTWAQSTATQISFTATAQVLQDLLVAEIATKQKQYLLASQAYIDAYQQTQDSRLIHQAFQLAVLSGNTNLTYRIAQRWVENDPNGTDPAILAAYNTILLVNIEQQNKKTVVRYLEKIYLKQNKPTVWLESLVRHTYKNANPTEADFLLPLLQPYLKKHKKDATLALTFAQVEKLQGETDLACQNAYLAFSKNTSHEKTARMTADICWTVSPEKSLQILETHLRHNEKSALARLVYARALLHMGKTNKALKEIEQSLHDAPSNASLLYDAATILFEAKNWSQAQLYFQNLLSLVDSESTRDQIYLKLGQTSRALQNWEKAEQYYSNIQTNPFKLQGALRKAQLWIQQGKIRESNALYRQLQVNYPRHIAVIEQEQIFALDRVEKYKESFTILQKQYAQKKQDESFLFSYASHAILAKKHKEARSILLELLQINPQHAMALNTLGYIWVEKGIHLKEARALLEEADQIEPLNSYILDSLGWLNFQEKKI